jgi:arylsulfatase A-like enzyme
LLLAAACARPDPPLEVAVDLVSAFRHTDAGCERARIDLGTPDGDAFLVEGWAIDPDEGVAWAVERRATLRSCIVEPAERSLVLRARALPGELRRRERRTVVSVRLNRQHVATIRVGGELETFELALPAHVQRPGDNLLELEHPMLRTHAGLRASSMPPGSVGYDWIELATRERRAGTNGPRATLDGEALRLPAGAQVETFFRAPANARLRLALAGDREDASLRVVVRHDGTAPRTLAELPAPREPRRIELPLDGDPGRAVGLSLVAVGAGSLQVVAPAVVAPRRPARSRGGSPAAAPASAGPPANVLLYVIDTLRADHLGCYGYDLPTSPRIDALAREGILFERVVAQSSWTRPAVASILTGLDAHAHRVMGLRQSLPAGVPTLAEILAARGYATAAWITNVNVSAPFGFGRGFASFEYLAEDVGRESTHVLSDELTRRAVRWLATRDTRPFFLYVHASDPHAPYTAAPELRGRFRRGAAAEEASDAAALRRKLDQDAASLTPAEVRELAAAYDAEIAFNDSQLGLLLDEIDRLGLRDSTLVVVTADHGEELRDHGGVGHGYTLYEEVIRVPLVVRLPDGAHAGERRTSLARQIDVLPTILGRLGIPAPSGLAGRALVDEPDDAPHDLEAYSHTRLSRREVAAVVGGSWKAIRYLGSPIVREEVFDLAADPGERRNLAAERPVLAGYGTSEIRRAEAAPGEAAPTRPLDADTERRLRALGYAE